MNLATRAFLCVSISLLFCGCVSSDTSDPGSELPGRVTIDGVWRVHADEIYDDCDNGENPCAEGEDDECINSNEWFWVTVQNYADGIYTADFAMSDLYWEDVVIENDVFDNTLDLSVYGWLYRIYGTMTLDEMTATIELGALDLLTPESKFYCRVIYELWGYPLYDANTN